MSWPSDGAPRFKVASIRGGTIGSVPGSTGDDAMGSIEYYVLDRANCHRVVRRVLVYSGYGAPRAGRDVIERFCARLNGEPLPL